MALGKFCQPREILGPQVRQRRGGVGELADVEPASGPKARRDGGAEKPTGSGRFIMFYTDNKLQYPVRVE
ncbi:hypothetical protein, partial [Pelagibacterium montanilacus]|uniref:hypothetical protein n=1 Tax=Pelagibacterium montanilacus TaxID=2185280 RepID=UPI0019D00138